MNLNISLAIAFLPLYVGSVSAEPSVSDMDDTCLNAGVYTYANIGHGDPGSISRTHLVIDTVNNRIGGGHASIAIEVCQDSESVYCISGPHFDFAIPKSGVSLGNHWTTERSRFEVVKVGSISILGFKDDVFVILRYTSNKEASDVFYYSSTRGLLGFSKLTSEGNPSVVALSESGVGFPFPNCNR